MILSGYHFVSPVNSCAWNRSRSVSDSKLETVVTQIFCDAGSGASDEVGRFGDACIQGVSELIGRWMAECDELVECDGRTWKDAGA